MTPVITRHRFSWAAAARLVIAGWMAKAVLGWVDGGAVAIVQQMAGDIEF